MDLEGLYNHIENYIKKHKTSLLNNRFALCGPLISTLTLEFLSGKAINISDECNELWLNKSFPMSKRTIPVYGEDPFIWYKPKLESEDITMMFSIRRESQKKKDRKTDEFYYGEFLKNNFINIEQIAINFSNKKMYYTPEFLLFYRSHELKFSGGFTSKKVAPLLSWKEYLSKNNVKYYLNEDFIKILRTISHPIFRNKLESFSFWSSFYKDNLNIDFLKQYFDIHILQKQRGLVNYFEIELLAKDVENDTDNVYNFISDLDRKKQQMPLYNHCRLEEIYKEFEYIYEMKGTVQKNLLYASTICFFQRFKSQDFSKEISPRYLARMKNLIHNYIKDGHHRTISNFNNLTKQVSFYDMVEFIYYFDKYYKQTKDLIFIGFFETLFVENIDFSKVSSGRDLFAQIKKMCEIDISNSKKDLIDPVFLNDFDWKHCVKELTSHYDLRKEGLSMRHCIGGYGSQLVSGGCRIFHINFRDSHSTLEISNRNEEFYFKEHRTTSNQQPSVKNIVVAKRLIEYLNKVYYNIDQELGIQDVYSDLF